MGARALTTISEDFHTTALDDGANREVVLDGLAKVLNHPTFRDTKRLKRFLEYVVMETLDGRGARLKGYSLGVEVFDKQDDFDPQGDTIVRVQAGQLRRRLDLYYAQDGLKDPVRILLPKGRYEPVFELRREILPDTVTERPQLIAVQTQDALARPGILVPSITNLSGDESYKYFAEGLTSELVNALVQFRYLRIITGTPMVDTITPMTNKDVALTYNAQFILSGNVRRAKDLMRISVNLINAESGAHLLSKTYDRHCTAENLFEVQEEIASYVSAAVATPNGAVNRYNRRLNKGRTANMWGYETLLQYFSSRTENNLEALEDLIAEFDKVLDQNLEFSSGWAAQSLLYSLIVARSFDAGKATLFSEKALLAARKAVTLHSENSLAYHASFIANYFVGNVEQYEKDAAMAIALNPNDYTMLLLYSRTRFCLGDFEGAKSYNQAAHDLIAIPSHWNMSVKYLLELMDGNYENTVEYVKQLTVNSSPGALMTALALAGHSGEHEAIQPLKAELLALKPDFSRSALKIFSRWRPTPEIFEKVRAGLEKAGCPDTPKAAESL